MNKLMELINNLKKTEKGKAVLFFAGYLVFFVALAVFMIFGAKNTTRPSDYMSGKNSDNVSMDKLSNENYLFTYKVNLDGVEYIYNGKRNKSVELFQFNNISYYKNGDSYYVKNNDLWIKSENPYIFYDFLDSSKLENILELCMLDSKTSYEDGRNAYNLLISTNTINQKLNGIDSDFLEEPNKITITSNNDSDINEVSYDLSSYCTLNKLCQSSLKITLTYDMFGEIKEIENPVV